jgi:hypothetical protein
MGVALVGLEMSIFPPVPPVTIADCPVAAKPDSINKVTAKRNKRMKHSPQRKTQPENTLYDRRIRACTIQPTLFGETVFQAPSATVFDL